MPCQAAMSTMQSHPENVSVSLARSRMDSSRNSAPFFKSRGARTSRMTGMSPRSSSLGVRVWPRFPDPPVSSTFILFSPAYPPCTGNMQAGPAVCRHRIEDLAPPLDGTRRTGMSRSRPPRKVTYFEPVPPRLARNTIIESTFEVGRRFRCTMRVDCGELDPRAVIRPVPGEWHPRMPEQLDEEELADWRAGRDAVYQLAALTIGVPLAVADA